MRVFLFILGFALSSAQAQTPSAGVASNPCAPILLACEDKGYVDDAVADAGKRIWMDCANGIINHQQTIRGLKVEDSDVIACRKYKAVRTGYLIDRE